MNIYLDIDGVLLVDVGRAALGADEFLRKVLEKYPDSTYWLTENLFHISIPPNPTSLLATTAI
jgi:hypothetical protein